VNKVLAMVREARSHRSSLTCCRGCRFRPASKADTGLGNMSSHLLCPDLCNGILEGKSVVVLSCYVHIYCIDFDILTSIWCRALSTVSCVILICINYEHFTTLSFHEKGSSCHHFSTTSGLLKLDIK
jgi:hypothetical protein